MSKNSSCSLLPQLLLSILLIAIAAPATAETPVGTFDLRFEGEGQDLIVLDKNATIPTFGFLAAECPGLKELPSGRVTAKCNTDVLGQGLNKTTITRWTKRIDDGVMLFQKAKFGGCIKENGIKACIKGDQTVSYPISASGGRGKVKVDFKVCAKFQGRSQCNRSKDTQGFDVPPLAGGANAAAKPRGWNLSLDLQAKGKNKVKGTGTVTIDEGRTIKLKASGKVNKQGVATLTFEPKSKKDKSLVELENVEFDGNTLTGDAKWKLLSQKGNAAFGALVQP